MNGPAYWGIAGYPISHSLTPRLFEIVGEELGLSAQSVYLKQILWRNLRLIWKTCEEIFG